MWSRRALRSLDDAAAMLEGVAFRALMAPDGGDLSLLGLCTSALDTLHALGAHTEAGPTWSEASTVESVARAGRILLAIDPSVIDRQDDRDRLGRVIAELSAFRAA